MLIERNFFIRNQIEQQALMEDTWCDTCNEAYIGLIDPAEYELDGKVYIEGLAENVVIELSLKLSKKMQPYDLIEILKLNLLLNLEAGDYKDGQFYLNQTGVLFFQRN